MLNMNYMKDERNIWFLVYMESAIVFYISLFALDNSLIKRGREIMYSCPRNTQRLSDRIAIKFNIPFIIRQLFQEPFG
jgi:hypothetical protein